jgi:hypothetical protein
MSSEVRELNKQIDWYRERQDSGDEIQTEIFSLRDDINKITGAIVAMTDIIKAMSSGIDKNADAIAGLASVIEKLVTAPPQHVDAFSELAKELSPLPKRPKRQKFKPTIVDKDPRT